MKTSNKVLLAMIVSFFIIIVFAAIIMRINLGSRHPIGFTRNANLAGKNVTKVFNAGDFSEIDINGAAYVSIKIDKKPSISISADEGYLANIDTTLMGNKLRIDMMHGIGKRLDRKVDISIITSHQLKKITTSGAIHLDYANVNSNELFFETSGASHSYLSGKVNFLQIETSGASHVDAKNLEAYDVSLETSGAADVAVNAKNSLKINSSGMAHINYYGKPKNIVRSVSGISSITSME